MPDWPRLRQAASTTATNIPTTTETVLVTTPPLSTDGAAQQVSLQATAIFATGTATTAVRLRIRRGTGITGTVVADSGSVVAAASSGIDLGVDGVDSPGEVADQQYVLTVQQTSATGNGTAQLAAIAAAATS